MVRRSAVLVLLACSLLGLTANNFVAADETAANSISTEDRDFFEKHVRPLLVKRCFECHGGAKTGGGLSLQTAAGWRKGGESGPAILPGRPEESLLIKAINYGELEMPPSDKGGKLPADEIAILAKWVEMGAPDPRTADPNLGGMTVQEAKSWWAFQPLPSAGVAASPAAIDGFIQRELEANSIQPSEAAEKRTLIRRATYDLTGVPPTPAEVDAFVADPSPDAFANIVERLLASPQYGVQWGRHWLDVVRYADTAGENTDRPLPHAWRYRNWVFDAFNRDMRYDDFVRLQLAGDIVCAERDPAQRGEGIVATGYLAIARRFGHDIDQDINLMHEDVIDNFGKNFLGLTTGCARCHDHKYDPISASDYYALYGIFNSSRFSFPGCEPKGQPRDLVPMISPAEVDALMKPWQERVATVEAEKHRRMESIDAASKTVSGLAKDATRTLATAHVDEGASVSFEDGKRGPLDHIQVRKGEVLQLKVLPNANHGADSTLLEWAITETAGSQRKWSVADLVQGLTQGNPQVDIDGASWSFLDVTDTPKFLTEKSESINGNGALKKWSIGSEPSIFVNASDQPVTVWTTLAAKSFFVHPGVNRPVAVAWISPLDGEVSITGRVADVHPAQLDGVSFQLDHIAAPEVGPALTRIGTSTLAGGVDVGMPPVIPVAYAVIDGKAENVRVHERGDREKLGEEVPRRWLSVFGGELVSENSGSGRRQLGDWIVQQPLSARVMVNRIWQWHFGQGLVRSPNDFGSRGEKPTHPELLDWLAAQFVASDYSVKAMHRLIMSTAAYQRSSATASATDPDNRLLAHFNRHRLSAEEIRDSLLVVSAQLDPTPAESHPFPPEATWGFTQHNPFNAVYDTPKRSAYLMVQRQRRHPFLALFDGADPNASTPTRQTTTVPTQALYFLNDSFFHAQAAAFAATLMKLPDDGARTAQAYRTLFQREPSIAERDRAMAFLNNYPAAPGEKWSAYARVLLASNEFIHGD
jgi:hypothetical protein